MPSFDRQKPFALISDIHANLQALNAVYRKICSLKLEDNIVCLGDIVGYGGSPNECINIIKDIAGLVIEGNHDRVASEKENAEMFNPLAKEGAYKTRSLIDDENKEWLYNLEDKAYDMNTLFTHGALSKRDKYIMSNADTANEIQVMKNEDLSALFVGHTHRTMFATERGLKTFENYTEVKIKNFPVIINPGSVGQPRDGIPDASFSAVNLYEGEAVFYRVEYDLEGASKAILKSEMPEYFAKRLFMGH